MGGAPMGDAAGHRDTPPPPVRHNTRALPLGIGPAVYCLAFTLSCSRDGHPLRSRQIGWRMAQSPRCAWHITLRSHLNRNH